jgi:hypothetical protein
MSGPFLGFFNCLLHFYCFLSFTSFSGIHFFSVFAPPSCQFCFALVKGGFSKAIFVLKSSSSCPVSFSSSSFLVVFLLPSLLLFLLGFFGLLLFF